MGEVCASCLDFDISKIVKSDNNLKPKWLDEHNYVIEFINSNSNNFKNKIMSNYNTSLTVNLGQIHSGKKVLYWASDEKKNTNPIVLDAKNAYNNFSNHGICTINNKGDATFKLRCPQIYNTIGFNKNKEQSYFRHMHFVVSNKEKTKWESQIFTKLVICKYDYNKTMKLFKSGNYVFINALPSEYYAQDHIPNSFNLFNKDIKKMSQSNLFEWFGNVIKLHYPNLHTLLKNKKINIREIPIITYCAHNKCNASQLAIEELLKKGFVNINEYSGGMKDYRNKYKN